VPCRGAVSLGAQVRPPITRWRQGARVFVVVPADRLGGGCQLSRLRTAASPDETPWLSGQSRVGQNVVLDCLTDDPIPVVSGTPPS
jgi:hypothetical protein